MWSRGGGKQKPPFPCHGTEVADVSTRLLLRSGFLEYLNRMLILLLRVNLCHALCIGERRRILARKLLVDVCASVNQFLKQFCTISCVFMA